VRFHNLSRSHQFKKELRDYATATATIRFPLDDKLPVVLIKKLVRARMKLNEAKKGKLKHHG
jgi:uncharacterized protein YdhG (YjbR/CyaY superfamily)